MFVFVVLIVILKGIVQWFTAPSLLMWSQVCFLFVAVFVFVVFVEMH